MGIGDASFTIFDVETTGLDPRAGHRIIEIAGVRVEKGTTPIGQTFSSLVNPERDVPPEAQHIHGLRQQDLLNASTITDVLPKFLTFVEGTILIAHNAQFDMGFLEVEKEVCWGYIDLPECLCTLSLSRSVSPRETRHSLDVVAERLGLPIPQNRLHRALSDALLTTEVFLHLLGRSGVRTLEDLRSRASLQLAWR